MHKGPNLNVRMQEESASLPNSQQYTAGRVFNAFSPFTSIITSNFLICRFLTCHRIGAWSTPPAHCQFSAPAVKLQHAFYFILLCFFILLVVCEGVFQFSYIILLGKSCSHGCFCLCQFDYTSCLKIMLNLIESMNLNKIFKNQL